MRSWLFLIWTCLFLKPLESNMSYSSDPLNKVDLIWHQCLETLLTGLQYYTFWLLRESHFVKNINHYTFEAQDRGKETLDEGYHKRERKTIKTPDIPVKKVYWNCSLSCCIWSLVGQIRTTSQVLPKSLPY